MHNTNNESLREMVKKWKGIAAYLGNCEDSQIYLACAAELEADLDEREDEYDKYPY